MPGRRRGAVWQGGLHARAGRPARAGDCQMIRPKRILLHLSPLADVGGCEINCLRVIEGLDDYAHHVVVFAGRGPMSARWEEAGASVHDLAAWKEGRTKFRAALAAWTKSRSCPAGIFYWSTSRLPTVVEALRHWDVPIVVHGGNPVVRGLLPGLRRWVQERVYPAPRAVRLAACSQHVAASHRRACYFRRLATEVIHNAVDPDFDRPRDYRALSPGSAPRLGMVARLDAIKDHTTVIRALAGIAPTRPDIVVEFAGDGPLKKNLEEEARRLGVTRQVRFLGFTQVGPRLADWDMLVHAT